MPWESVASFDDLLLLPFPECLLHFFSDDRVQRPWLLVGEHCILLEKNFVFDSRDFPNPH